MAAQPKNQMTDVLAFHIGRQDNVQKFVDALPHFVSIASAEEQLAVMAGVEGVEARNPDNDRLKVLIDGDSQKMVTQLYQNYVSEENFVLFIEFVKGMDRFIVKFRELAQSREIAQQVPSEEDEDAEIGGSRSRRRGRGGRARAPAAQKPGPILDEQQPAPNEEELRRDDAPSATVAALARFFGEKTRA